MSFFSIREKKSVVGICLLIEDRLPKLDVVWTDGKLFPMKVGQVRYRNQKIGVLPYEVAVRFHFLESCGLEPELLVEEFNPQALRQLSMAIWAKAGENKFIRPGGMPVRSVVA
jgi:hypothetical protein